MSKVKIERVPMKRYTSDDGIFGHAELSNLAVPLTMKVVLDGEEFAPVSFDCYGHPIFTKEQCELYRFKNFEYQRKYGESLDIPLVITYRVSTLNVSRRSFDSIEGIEKSLCGILELNTMLDNRKRYLKLNPTEKLNSFVLWGCFLLDEFGQVWNIDEEQKGSVISKSRVETYKSFTHNNIEEGFRFVAGAKQIAIPKPNSICPCCGKKLTVYDIQDKCCVYVKGKFYHSECYKKYVKAKEVLEFTERLMDVVYGKDNYQYELLPNGYCSRACCEHIPWFLFHTIHGDIVMGWRKRVISIEWQSNFKPFNMLEVFSSEDVTKWESQSKRGIHAWGKDKAIEYLTKVRDAVNLNTEN